MELFLYGFSGFVAAALGALPPGAVNLSVVYTTLNKGAKKALPIILAAAIGEIILSFLALHCTMFVEDYIQNNSFIQYVIALLLIVVGSLMLRKKKANEGVKKKKKDNAFFKGLLLSVLNPPVLVFWLLAFAYLASNTAVMVRIGLLKLTLIFFAGVFIGKMFTLWGYLQLSKRIEKRAKDITKVINKGIGALVLILGIIQLVKLIFEY